MKHFYFAVFLLSFFTVSAIAQSKDFTGASSQSSNISASSAPKTKAKLRRGKDALPTNSSTVVPLDGITTFPALSFKPVAAQGSVEEIVSIDGVKVGDKVELHVPRNSSLPGLSWIAWVVRDNQVKVRCTNTNFTMQTLPPQEVFKVHVQKN